MDVFCLWFDEWCLSDGFTNVRRDATVQWNDWWSAAHIVPGGNDSV